MHDDTATGVLMQERIQPVAQEPAHVLLRVGFAAEIGKRGINPQQVRSMLAQQRPHRCLEELLAALRVDARDDDVAKGNLGVGFAQLQTGAHAIAHLRQVTVVILRLDE
jgi:hypothetical protein